MTESEDPSWSLSRDVLTARFETERQFRESEAYGDFVRAFLESMVRRFYSAQERWRSAYRVARLEGRSAPPPEGGRPAKWCLALEEDLERARELRGRGNAPGR